MLVDYVRGGKLTTNLARYEPARKPVGIERKVLNPVKRPSIVISQTVKPVSLPKYPGGWSSTAHICSGL